ncbi:hypothetical protein EMIHUDRAFT_200480 [Emiliania huxleyi CCMP1516]|uniref:Class I SAM-dependent methyltransferase n=2 Tax=Emiliania huxleyi TaxID=2903 RepID=A0A0D3KQM6_EMIH1|nr:hypothetical protein EMIHUDRAFT_200480 [Emiliania huxleyi CCMP1516]EOD38061.1 hypothetical protein EMIHUDRAFT_200480 [Emiliania huxleyi CCMP1516]|eukprot:XP_005790490.1 hypothetical protein EMIHUDRAFT_200480 [Emiliania huxleyi CCMP1516]
MRASKQPIDGEHVEAGRRLALDPTTQSSFANVYRRHKWGGVGGGPLRRVLLALIRSLGVHSMLDIPCGALVWQQALFASLRAANHPLRYHGADIVPFLVESHQRKRRDLTSPLQGMEANFSVVDFSDRQAALPAGFDLLLSRDGLQHNTLQQIARGLYTFSRAAAKWLLIGSYPDSQNTPMARAGSSRVELDLSAPPGTG